MVLQKESWNNGRESFKVCVARNRVNKALIQEKHWWILLLMLYSTELLKRSSFGARFLCVGARWHSVLLLMSSQERANCVNSRLSGRGASSLCSFCRSAPSSCPISISSSRLPCSHRSPGTLEMTERLLALDHLHSWCNRRQALQFRQHAPLLCRKLTWRFKCQMQAELLLS